MVFLIKWIVYTFENIINVVLVIIDSQHVVQIAGCVAASVLGDNHFGIVKFVP